MNARPGLPREALARVLESLLRAEIAAARGRAGREAPHLPAGPWPDDLALERDVGADSLERLWLAGAVNEWFHLHALEREDDLLDAPRFGAWLDLAAAAWEGAGAVTVATSGSTGIPKRCTHAVADLALEIEGLAPLFAGRRRVVCAAPLHHIYGFLFGAMLPAQLGIETVVAAGWGPGAWTRQLRAGDLIIGFPDLWRFLERSLPGFAPDIAGTTSTAPCPSDLPPALTARGLAGFTEIYGSSETAGIGVRAWPDPAYALMPHWTPEATPAEPAVATLVHATGRRVDTMDRLAWEGPRRFTVAGRADGAVQVGGVNVFPAGVAERLRIHPLVRDAAVRPMPEAGGRLKAFVVLADGTDRQTAEAALTAWIAEAFTPPERPKALAFGAEVPRNALGKLIDWAVDPA